MPRPPTAAALADELERRLRTHAHPERALAEARYLKSELAFLGTGVPAARAVARGFQREHTLTRPRLLALVRALWAPQQARPLHERRVVAVELLTGSRALLEPRDLALVERLIRDSRSWAYVDALATGVAAALVEREPALTGQLDRWARDPDFWVRRAAMLALLPPLRAGRGDFARFARYADAMLDEREFFIRKAIGWVLRETAKRRPELVYTWLAPRAARASGVTLREAMRYLSDEQRGELLRGRPGRRAAAPAVPIEAGG